MATATAQLDLPCSYGNVSVGDKTTSIGVSIDRKAISIAKADKNFCGRRLTGKLIGMPPDEEPGQGHLEGMDPSIDLDGIFDVKRFSVSQKQISVNLVFLLEEDFEIEKLCHFAKRGGRLQIFNVEAIPDDKPNGTSDESDDE